MLKSLIFRLLSSSFLHYLLCGVIFAPQAFALDLYTIVRGLENPVSIEESEIVFNEIFANDSPDNVVFYIHGRGKNPEKNFYSWTIPEVEDYSNTRFLILSWPSWNGMAKRPINAALAASQDLGEFFLAYNDYKYKYPERINGKKVTFLAHSMGNVPLKVFIDEHYESETFARGLLDSIVMNGPDVPLAKHKEWIEKIDFAHNIFIAQHSGDIILLLSKLMFQNKVFGKQAKLGAGLGPIKRKYDENLARNAKYLNLSQLTTHGHRHFNMPFLLMTKKTKKLFAELLNGRDLEFPSPEIGLFKRIEDQPIFSFFNRDPLEISTHRLNQEK